MAFAHYRKTVYHKAFIIHMLIGLGENKSTGVFKFTWSKVKVTWVTCSQLCKHLNQLNILKTSDYKA